MVIVATLGPKTTRPQSTKTAVCVPVSPWKFQTAHQFLAWCEIAPAWIPRSSSLLSESSRNALYPEEGHSSICFSDSQQLVQRHRAAADGNTYHGEQERATETQQICKRLATTAQTTGARTRTHNTYTSTYAHTHAHTDTGRHKVTNTKQRRTSTTGPNNTHHKHRARVGWKLVLDNVLPDVSKPQLSVAGSSCHWHFAALAV